MFTAKQVEDWEQGSNIGQIFGSWHYSWLKNHMESTKMSVHRKCDHWFCPVFPLASEDVLCGPDLTVPHVLMAICFGGGGTAFCGLFGRVRMKS